MSSSSTSGSLFTPLQFTGISQYSSDFQSILNRAVSIAQLPAQALQQQEATITQQETDLSSLGSDVSGVETALQTIGNLGSGQALTASTSNSSVVSATNTGATTAASWTINSVTSLASAASEVSQSSYANATSTTVSATGSMQLVLGSNTYNITLASGQNNLNGLVSAINSSGAGVTASVLTTQSGDYLSISANSPGATTLKLIDNPSGGGSNILTSNNQGSNTVFSLNGISISTPSTTVDTVIPGVTLSFSSTSNSPTTVSLSSDRSQISNALQDLATAYNTLVDANNAQRGNTPGSLAGNNIIYQIGSALSSLTQYQGNSSSGVNSLSNLGIELDQNGHMSLNAQTFSALSDQQITAALSLFGSSTTGIGGLQQTFDAIANTATGTIASQEQQWQTQVTGLQNQITTMTDQINTMEQSLNQQLQAADASVAELSSQQSILTASITSLDYTAYGYNSNPSTTQST